jgi:hypothetical protein
MEGNLNRKGFMKDTVRAWASVGMMMLAVAVTLVLTGSISGCKKEEKPLAVALNGIVNFVGGTVKVDKAGSVVVLNVGDSLSEGMKVITEGKKSFAEIYIGDQAIKVTGNSILVFSRLAGGDAGQITDLTIEKGGAFSKISRKLEKNDSYTVRTQNAVAAVRGTEFYVSEKGGKSNIACVDGKVEVSSVSDEQKKVILEAKEEVDVSAGSELVKKQIADDKLNELKIISNIKDIQAEIRKRFEDQREEIRKAVVDQREGDKARVEEQKAGDKARIEEQKAGDKAKIDAAKGGADESAKGATDAAKQGMDDSKAKTDETKNAAASAVEALKKKNKEQTQ